MFVWQNTSVKFKGESNYKYLLVLAFCFYKQMAHFKEMILVQKELIIQEIERAVQGCNPKEYSAWYIGVTNDLERRKNEHGAESSVKFWKGWQANNEADARNIEDLFLKKHMKGGPGGGSKPGEDKPTYVYIF